MWLGVPGFALLVVGSVRKAHRHSFSFRVGRLSASEVTLSSLCRTLPIYASELSSGRASP